MVWGFLSPDSLLNNMVAGLALTAVWIRARRSILRYHCTKENSRDAIHCAHLHGSACKAGAIHCVPNHMTIVPTMWPVVPVLVPYTHYPSTAYPPAVLALAGDSPYCRPARSEYCFPG